jgi:hypothetical protein
MLNNLNNDNKIGIIIFQISILKIKKMSNV